MPRTDRDMPDTALPVDPRFVHPYPPVCPEAKQRLYVLPNNGSGGSNGGGNRNKHGGFAFTLFCCFCCCIVLFCIVLYCIVGFSGFLYIRKALLINGENWMFGFGFSAFLFVCFSGGFSVLKRVSSIARQVVFWGLFFASQCFLFLISVCK